MASPFIGIFVIVFVIVLLALAVVAYGHFGPKRSRLMRIIIAIIGSLILLPIAAFCVFGFMATFEPGEFMAFRIGYTVIGLGCLAGVVALIARCFRKYPNNN